MFLLHAFGVAWINPPHPPNPSRSVPPTGVEKGEATPPVPRRKGGTGGVGSRRAILLVGDIGAGKTTTGLALLHAGWKLLSNDSPILTDDEAVEVLSYPGLLSAYPDSLLRFPELDGLVSTDELLPTATERRKIIFAAGDFYPGAWIDRAPAGAIVFPQIESRADHALEPLPAAEALRLLLPNAVEQWDREMIPGHLALLRLLVEAAPAFRLRLGPDVNAIPEVIASALF